MVKKTTIHKFVTQQGYELVEKLGKMETSRALKISRVQLYRILKNLERKGMVESSFEYPTLFDAIPIGKVLDFLVNAKKEEARNLKQARKN